MSIVEDIRSYTNKLDVRFALAHYIKLYNLVVSIQRYIKKEFNSKNSIQFTSQDLRSLVIAIDKVRKAINKKTSFVELTKRVEKYEKITGSIFTEESKNFAKYCACAKYLQSCYSILNHSATLLYLIEYQYAQEKEKSDQEFTDSILYTLLEYVGDVND